MSVGIRRGTRRGHVTFDPRTLRAEVLAIFAEARRLPIDRGFRAWGISPDEFRLRGPKWYDAAGEAARYARHCARADASPLRSEMSKKIAAALKSRACTSYTIP